MKKLNKISLNEIEKKAARGEDVTMHFSGRGKRRQGLTGNPERVQKNIQKVNVDFSQPMLKELDLVSAELNVSRQSVIKTWLRQSLDNYHLAKKAR